MKALDRRLAKLEEAAGVGAPEPMTIEHWIIDAEYPARQGTKWLHSRMVAGQPETFQRFGRGEIVRRWARDDHPGRHGAGCHEKTQG